MKHQRLILLTLIIYSALSIFHLQAAPTLISRWDFDNYNPAAITDVLRPTVGNQNLEVRTGNNFSSAVVAGCINNAYVVDGSVAPGLAAGDRALALPKGTHLKVPFPSNVIKAKHWTLRVRFFYPSASGGKVRSVLQPNLNNNAQYLYGIKANNYFWADDTSAPAKSYFAADPAENGESAGNTGSRTVGVTLWHTLDVSFGSNGVVALLNGTRTSSSVGSGDARACFTGDGLLLFADNNNEDELVYVASVELWQDTTVYHNGGAYLQTSSANIFSTASLNDIRDGYISCRGLGTWMAYSTPMGSMERIVTDDGNGNATAIKLDLVTWGGDQNVLAQLTQNGDNVAGYSLRMAWNLGWNARYFTDAGGFVSGQQTRAAGASWNYAGYAPYNLFCSPFTPLKGNVKWTKLMGVGKFGSPHVMVCTGSPTLTFDQAPQADSLYFGSGLGNGRVNLTFAYNSDALKTMSSLHALNLDKNVTLTVPTGVSVGGAVSFQKGAELAVAGASTTTASTLFTATGGISLPAGTTIADFVRSDTGTISLSQDETEILYTPFAANAVATAQWTGEGEAGNLADAANWSCRGIDGQVIAEAVPTADTTVLVTGETVFSVPADSNFTCRRLAFSGTVTLAADCDWSGLHGVAAVGSANVAIPQGKTLTLLNVDDFYANCNFSGAGRLKATFDGTFGGEFPASVQSVAETELSGAVTLNNCNWMSGNRLILSGEVALNGEGSHSTTMPGPVVIPEGAVVTVNSLCKSPALQGNNFKQHIIVDGGTMTGAGYLYFSAWDGQELDLDIKAGRMEVALRPWASYYADNCKLVQTGGVFAPSSLQPQNQNNVYKGTLSSYTFKGGVFEPPAGWTTTFPWLPITVPADYAAAIHVVRSATIASSLTVNGALSLGSDDPAYTLTLAGLAGSGTLNVTNGSPRLAIPAGNYALTLQSAADTSLALGCAGTAVFSHNFTNETFLGSLTLTGGAFTLPPHNSIGGTLVLDAGATLRFDLGAETVPALAPLFSAEDGITLPPDTALTDVVSVTVGTVTMSDDGKQILYVPDLNVPLTAVWTGAGDRTDPTDTANWACTNAIGSPIVAVPTAATTIFLSGDTSLNIPAGTMPACRELRITGPVALTADCDWRGLDSLSRLTNGTLIDLKGQTLTLAGPNGASPTSFTVTNSVTTAGQLKFDVASGATFTNSKIALRGNLTLVKDGAGTFIPELRSQTYNAGTDILAGTVKATTCGTDAPLGQMWGSNKVYVREGATFDIGTSYHFTVYPFVLDGGTFLASGTNANMCRFGNTTLTADSTWDVNANNQFWSSHTLNLGGHTLTVDIVSGLNMNLGEVNSSSAITITNGTVDVISGGWFRILSPVKAQTADFRVNSALEINSSFDVHDYENIYPYAYGKGTGKMRVFGSFIPHGNMFYGCEMQDGSTLNLSYLDGTWSIERMTGNNLTGNGTVTFVDNATVMVDLGSRVVGLLTKVVGWTAAPANLDTLTFKAPAGRYYRIIKKSDGVYAACGMVILVR